MTNFRKLGNIAKSHGVELVHTYTGGIVRQNAGYIAGWKKEENFERTHGHWAKSVWFRKEKNSYTKEDYFLMYTENLNEIEMRNIVDSLEKELGDMWAVDWDGSEMRAPKFLPRRNPIR